MTAASLEAKFWNGASKALFDSDLIGTRLTLAIAEFAWAVMLLWPGETFGRPTYSGMAAVGAEQAWALVFLLSAATQTMIVLMDDYHNRFARYFAAWNAVLWAFIVVSMLLSVYPPPAAIGGELALGTAAIWICVRPFILSIGYNRAAPYTRPER